MIYERNIIEKNPWWLTGKLPEVLLGIQRLEYLEKISLNLESRKILAILGIRRSGKSTLIYQSINQLLEAGVDPKKIFYLTADDLKEPSREHLEHAFDFYQQQNMVSIKDTKTYVFIDEIQNINEWQLLLKNFYDLKYASKFVVSGSSSSLIYRDSSESLVGRISFLDVYPLTFREFLQFNNIEVTKPALDFNSMKETNYQLSLRENEILGFLSQYLTVGGFPEWFEVKNEDAWFKILSEEYTSLLLYKDIIKVFSIRDPLLLESIFKFVATHSSERFSYLGIAKENDGDKETSRHYIFHLAHSRLMHLSGFYTKSKKASERKEKKIFFCDVGLKNSFGRVQDVGHDAENVAFLHCLIEGSKDPLGKLFYWYDKNKNEVDIVMDYQSTLVPVEVKYRNSVGVKDLKGLVNFCNKFDIQDAFVVTKTMLDEQYVGDVRIVFIPLWLFLLAF